MNIANKKLQINFKEFILNNSIHLKILQLSLSGSDKIERKKKLEKLWFEKSDENLLFQLAQTDEVASHIGCLLQETQLRYSPVWQKECKAVEKRVTILMDTLEEVAQHLKKNEIEIVALKNAGITKGIYPVYACSPMGDIDLLVSVKDFYKAHHLITEELRFTFKFRSELEEEDLEEAFKGGGTEYFKEVEGYTVWLELQWRPIAGRWIQPHNEPKGDELLKRSIPVQNSTVRILAPEDNLLQVALHTAKHSYVRAPGFRLHSDVDRIVRYQEIDWNYFVKKVKVLKLITAVYFSLYFASILLETPIPLNVLSELKPNWLRRRIILHYINKAGIFNQKKKKFSKLGYIIFNLALYDSIFEIGKAIFPPFDSLKIKYDIGNRWELPYYYIKRLKDLAFKRAKL